MNSAIFAGSFDPFTLGHADIVSRALEIFDEVTIAIGYNIKKVPAVEPERNREMIAAIYAENPRIKVCTWSGLTAELARKLGIRTLVRGVRDVKDFEYERNLAEINRRIAGLETVLLPARPELSCCSSSNVRELKAFGEDISSFLLPGYIF